VAAVGGDSGGLGVSARASVGGDSRARCLGEVRARCLGVRRGCRRFRAPGRAETCCLETGDLTPGRLAAGGLDARHGLGGLADVSGDGHEQQQVGERQVGEKAPGRHETLEMESLRDVDGRVPPDEVGRRRHHGQRGESRTPDHANPPAFAARGSETCRPVSQVTVVDIAGCSVHLGCKGAPGATARSAPKIMPRRPAPQEGVRGERMRGCPARLPGWRRPGPAGPVFVAGAASVVSAAPRPGRPRSRRRPRAARAGP